MCRHKIGMCESYSPVPCDETVIRDNKVHLAWCQVVTGLLGVGVGGCLTFFVSLCANRLVLEIIVILQIAIIGERGRQLSRFC